MTAPARNEVEDAARGIVAAVVSQAGGSFDYAKHGDLIECLVMRGGFRSVVARDTAQLLVKESAMISLCKARDAITFEALWTDDHRGWIWDRSIVGHCVHRAKSILSDLIRKVEAQ